LSVDSTVWPKVVPGVDKSARAPTQWRDLWLWENLHQLREYIQQNRDAVQHPYMVIGITLLRDVLTMQEQPVWDALLATTVPASLNKKWTFLGYDVADEGFISGLSDCGYEASEQRLRIGWRPYLNDWHLFTKKDQAIKFKKMTDQRVPEHAPFQVYGLYSLIHL
ncbi:MAG TPA: hypothetical protein VKR06_27305, partial [Ktedonosporobacter sp.]|nr:hypothetical protein [Ktedonosporobacter sp.]